MGKIVEAFWERFQVWPELCPKGTIEAEGGSYTHSCLECIIEGKMLCDPDSLVAVKIPKEKPNPRMAGEWRQCPVCRGIFYAYSHKIKRGAGKFCSKRCAGIAKGCPKGICVTEFRRFRIEQGKKRGPGDFPGSS